MYDAEGLGKEVKMIHVEVLTGSVESGVGDVILEERKGEMRGG